MTEEVRGEVVPISSAQVGDIARFRGAIRAIVVEPGDAAPALTATIVDDTGTIDAVFMGRREIPGIEPGRVVTMHGRVAGGPGGLHIFNPWYELAGSDA